MYLPILHLPRVQLGCKLQEKLHRVTGPLLDMFEKIEKIHLSCNRAIPYKISFSLYVNLDSVNRQVQIWLPLPLLLPYPDF